MGLFDRVGRFLDDVLLLPDDVRQSLELGEQALSAELFAEAERAFLDALAARPSLTRAGVGLARARYALGDEAGALTALREAREGGVLDGPTSLFGARLALRLADHDMAAECARDASRALAETGGSSFLEALTLRANAERGRGRPGRAATELNKILSIRDDDSVRIALVEALVDAGRVPEAQRAAGALEPAKLEVELCVRAGLALLRTTTDGETSPAAYRFLRAAADSGDPSALVALARGELRHGDVGEAEHYARTAIIRGGGSNALATLADVLVAQGRGAEAAEAVEAAAMASGDVELYRGAIRVAPMDDAEALTRYADALTRVAPDDPVERLARGLVALAEATREPGEPGDRDKLATVRGLVDQVGDEPRGVLLRARLAIESGDPRGAIAELDQYASFARGKLHAAVDAPLVTALRREAHRRAWSVGGSVDLAGAIDAVAAFAETQGLREVERETRALRAELDRPLLLAVLGEFNAGKSTMINAFIGAKVAPMGIVPTTATLNVLRGGAERRVRLVRDDGGTREGDYDSLGGFLDDAEEAGQAVDHVEIVLPSERLESVWIMDSPGTNALDPAHERLAKEAARRADAVLWVFDAAQAGKKTEASFYQAFRDAGREVVPVLNKRDRLKEGELERVLRVVRDGWGDEGPKLDIVAISARTALKARLNDDDAALEASGFSALLAHLDVHIFSRSRELKRRACASRLVDVLDRALANEAPESEAYEERARGHESSARALEDTGDRLASVADDVTRSLDEALRQVFEAAARELLHVVERPATTGLGQFGRNAIDAEERGFISEALERSAAHAVEKSERRLLAQARGVLAQAATAPVRGGDPHLRAAIGPAFAAFAGLQRGLLRVGLRRYFEEVLPRGEVTAEAVDRGLAAYRADARSELLPALREQARELVATLAKDERAAATALRAEREEIVSRVFEPLRALRDVLDELERHG